MSFQITISPSKRAAARFVSRVRRAIQQALAEENIKSGVSQSDIAREIGVNRSVVSREIRGHKDLTLSRVAELASALGRVPTFSLPEKEQVVGSNSLRSREALSNSPRLSPIFMGAPNGGVSPVSNAATNLKPQPNTPNPVKILETVS